LDSSYFSNIIELFNIFLDLLFFLLIGLIFTFDLRLSFILYLLALLINEENSLICVSGSKSLPKHEIRSGFLLISFSISFFDVILLFMSVIPRSIGTVILLWDPILL